MFPIEVSKVVVSRISSNRIGLRAGVAESVSVGSEELAHHVQGYFAMSEGESVDYVDQQCLEAGSRWYVSCDGVHTLSQDGSYHEVKVGFCIEITRNSRIFVSDIN